jgi:hypothetical protein
MPDLRGKQPSAYELEKKINLFQRQFCKEFLEHYKEAERAWVARELGNEAYKDGIPRSSDFEKWVKQRTTTDFPQTVRNWERDLSNASQNASDSFNFSIAKIWQVNELFRSSGLTKRDISSFFVRELKNIQSLLDIALELTAIPQDYLSDAKKKLKEQVDLQVLRVYEEFWRQLEEFKYLIEQIIRGDKSGKRKKLNDLVSTMFTWYVTTFSQERAIILVKSQYWNGVHRRIYFNRSRTTREFVSCTPDLEHQVDILWLLKEMKIDIIDEKFLNQAKLLETRT